LDELASSRIGVEEVDEAGIAPRAEIEEGQGLNRSIHPRRKPGGVALHLGLYASEGVPLGLGLQDADGLFVNEKQVVGVTVPLSQFELADGDATSRAEIDLLSALDDPPGLVEELVNLLASNPLGANAAGRRQD
jgi:hypothetical protein